MNSKQVLGEEEIRQAEERIVAQVLQDIGDHQSIALVGIITRGATLARRMADIAAKKHDVKVEVGTIDARPFRDDLKKEAAADRSEMPFPVTHKDIVLVDDVMSTGRTIRAAMDALMSRGRPNSVKTAVLIDRGHRQLPISADYVGVQIPTSVKETIRVRLSEIDGGKDGAYITAG
jgi:pyrimidine operon attenuation protein / uracil phosphoribosyltransferase